MRENANASSIDLRPVYTNWGLPLRLQGDRSTCSVFTMAAAMEYALAAQQRRAIILSVEFLNWASNEATRNSADGSFFSDIWTGFVAYGACQETDMPYQAKYDPKLRPSDTAMRSASELREAGLRLHWIKAWDVKTGLTDAQFLEIKKTLARQWPVCAGLRWPKQQRWTDSVLEMAPPEGVVDGHSVLLVGFRDDPKQPGGGVFLIRNSGAHVHDGAMTYEYARAYTNDAVWIDYDTTPAPASRPAALRELLTPLGLAPAGRNRRVSSNEQPNWHDGNMDMTWLMPGESVEMPILRGPGLITHMWFTSHAGWVGELNALVLRIYWDGIKDPAVEVPLGDFFAVGHGKPAVVESIPVQVSPTGSLSCYWRMPFGRSARIVVTNDNPDRSTGLYWQVDCVELDEPLPPDIPYFYARYRQEHPAVAGRDYTIADMQGAGFYVGTVLSVTNGQDGWFGEGDDYFYVDGEQVPSLQGTGTEDYFNDAWGFRRRTGPWFGQARWQGDRAGDSGVCYRWHLPDPVNFTKSLKLDIEHKGNCDDDLDGFYIERPDFLSSVAFWYQTGQPKPFGEVPPWHQRRVPWEIHHFVRALRQAKTTGPSRVQIETTGFFGARPVLVWANKTPDAELTVPFHVHEEGRYALRLTACNLPDGASYDIALDHKRILSSDFRSAEPSEADLLLGTHALAKGEHTISFKAASEADRTGSLVVEMLRTLRLPPEAKRTVRTHHEAHFVRLGIGRAVYAYRLAYDKLPDSLQTLVDSGIMPARYSGDENGRPLKSRIEDGCFVVESTAPGGWKHRWQGLDARR
jgi:hypothetical protein